MRNTPQLACESCNEFIDEVKQLKHEAAEAKRQPLAQMQAFVTTLQAKLGALQAHAEEIKAYTLPAVAAANVREYTDYPDRKSAAAHDNTLALPSEA